MLKSIKHFIDYLCMNIFFFYYLFVAWMTVATWRWVANDENCGICRMAFESCCTECDLPGDDCPLVWGACSHCFHMHCIMKWLNSQTLTQQCPMCRQVWKFNDK